MSEANKVIKDGMVAVLVTGDYGAGWSTGNNEQLMFEPIIVHMLQAIEKWEGDGWARCNATMRMNIQATAEVLHPEGYWAAAKDLRIVWVPVMAKFRIMEKDGFEWVELRDDIEWLTA